MGSFAIGRWRLFGILLIGLIQGVAFSQTAGPPEAPSLSQSKQAINEAAKAREWYLKGDAARRNDNILDSIQAFREAVRLEPSMALYHLALGQALAQNNEIEPSIVELSEASRLNPKDGESRALLGVALHKKKDIAGAVSEVQKALTLHLSPGSQEKVRLAIKSVLELPANYLAAAEEEQRQLDPRYWFNKIEEWRIEVEQHRPGESDLAAVKIGSCPLGELVLAQSFLKALLRQPLDQLAKMPKVEGKSIPDFLGIQKEVDKNTLLKRGALLHTDIALLGLELRRDFRFDYLWSISMALNVRISALRNKQKRINSAGLTAIKDTDLMAEIEKLQLFYLPLLQDAAIESPHRESQPFALIQDGKTISQDTGAHMERARYLLGAVMPNPSRDAMVKQWYIATIAYALSLRPLPYRDKQIEHALKIFPSDSVILFYAGLLHETYAAPYYQNALPPPGVVFQYDSRKSELIQACRHFRSAVSADAGFAEAHLRLGRVLGLQGDHKEAVEELQRAAAAATDVRLRYYAALFLGQENGILRHREEARKQLELASTLFSTAQSPLLVLSQLA